MPLTFFKIFSASSGKTVVVGVVSGRNIWRTDLGAALAVLESLRGAFDNR